MKQSKTVIVTFLFLLMAGSGYAAQFQVYKGDSVTVENSNTTIYWGKNYTFDATGLKTVEGGIEIMRENSGNQEIIIFSDNGREVEATLNDYSIENVQSGDTVIDLEVETDSNANVSYSFSGLPGLDNSTYILEEKGQHYRNFSSGGTLSWNSAGSDSYSFDLRAIDVPHQDLTENNTQNTTQPEENQTQENQTETENQSEDDDDTEPAPPPVPSPDENESDQEEDQGPEVEQEVVKSETFGFESLRIKSIVLRTTQNASNLEVNVSRSDGSELPALNGSIQQYDITSPVKSEELREAVINFEVSGNLVDRVERIKLMRYEDGWNTLGTQYVGTEEGMWKYKATSPGMGYHAIRVVPESSESQSIGGISKEQVEQILLASVVLIVVLILAGLVIGYIYVKDEDGSVLGDKYSSKPH